MTVLITAPPHIEGIYHVGDEQPVTLQEFLDEACRVWRCRPPRRIPFSMTIARTRSPLTRDFVRLGRLPHWGDTSRARHELIPTLTYPTLASGLSTLGSPQATR